MTVAVVVPCRNEAAHIAALLDALAGQSRTPDEIIIVNDASTDATADVVRAWASAHVGQALRLVEGAGKGPGPAMNVGIRATAADVIMRMDGHAIPSRDYLELSLEGLRAHVGGVGGVGGVGEVRRSSAGAKADGAGGVGEVRRSSAGAKADGVGGVGEARRSSAGAKAGVVGGVWDVRPGADTAVARAIAAVVSHPLGSGGAAYRSTHATGPERMRVETVPFGTFPRAVWDTLGGFDESLSANQDFDFNYRARKAGYDVVLDRRIRATYFARPTFGALSRQYSRYGFWKVQMLRKDPRAFHPRQLPPALVAPWLVLSAVVLLVTDAPVAGAIAALYPLIVLLGGLHVGLTRAVNPLWAVLAVATVHISWSSGFWQGVVRR